MNVRLSRPCSLFLRRPLGSGFPPPPCHPRCANMATRPRPAGFHVRGCSQWRQRRRSRTGRRARFRGRSASPARQAGHNERSHLHLSHARGPHHLVWNRRKSSIKTPTVPCRSSRTPTAADSSLVETERGAVARPSPKPEPTMAPATLVKVATRNAQQTGRAIGAGCHRQVGRQVEWGGRVASVNVNSAKPRSPAASAASMTACSHATPSGWRPPIRSSQAGASWTRASSVAHERRSRGRGAGHHGLAALAARTARRGVCCGSTRWGGTPFSGPKDVGRSRSDRMDEPRST